MRLNPTCARVSFLLVGQGRAGCYGASLTLTVRVCSKTRTMRQLRQCLLGTQQAVDTHMMRVLLTKLSATATQSLLLVLEGRKSLLRALYCNSNKLYIAEDMTTSHGGCSCLGFHNTQALTCCARAVQLGSLASCSSRVAAAPKCGAPGCRQLQSSRGVERCCRPGASSLREQLSYRELVSGLQQLLCPLKGHPGGSSTCVQAC